MNETLSVIAQYYDKSQIFYDLFWSPEALHYGIWYPQTKSLAEAVSNTNQHVVDVLEIDSRDTVLDAGCGVGGSSTFIAEHTGACVTGLTLSEVQLKKALARASRSKAAERLSFLIRDYSETNLPDRSFSVVFGIESICHAENKGAFLREAHRLLSPGGRLAVVDAFLIRESLSAEQMRVYEGVCRGWVIPNLASIDHFASALRDQGFENVEFHDMRRHIVKSIRRIHRQSYLSWPLNVGLPALGFGRINLAPRCQQALFVSGIATYGTFTASVAT